MCRFMVLLLLLLHEVRAASRSQWHAKFDEVFQQYRASYPNAFDRSSNLAWAEAYILDALAVMYEATGDTKYLDHFTERLNLQLTTLKDDIGQGSDGYLGWGEWVYSVDGVANPNAEQSSDPLTPSGWKRWQSTSATAYRDTSVKYEGAAGFTVKTSPSGGWQVFETPLTNPYRGTYEPNTTYQLDFFGKVSNCEQGVSGRFTVYDFTAKKTLFAAVVSSTSFAWAGGTFKTPAQLGHDIRVRLYHTDWTKQCTVHFDNIRVKAWSAYLVHEGMMAGPIAKFIRLVKQNKAPSTYSADADAYLALLEKHIFPKWDRCLALSLSGNQIYLIPHDASLRKPGQSLPHNQYLAMQRAYAELSMALPQSGYGWLAEQLMLTFKSTLKTSGNRFEWNYWDVVADSDSYRHNLRWDGSEDTSHGNLDILAAVTTYHAGLAFSSSDMAKFAGTLKYMLVDCPSFSKLVNSCSGTANLQSLRWWLKLGEFDPSLYAAGKALLDTGYSSAHRGMLNAIAEVVRGFLVEKEGFNTAALPSGWTRWQSTPSTVYTSNAAAFRGHAGLVVTTNGAAWQTVYLTLHPPHTTTYSIQVMGRVASGNLGGRVEVYDPVQRTVVARKLFWNTQWELVRVDFTAAPGQTLWIQLYTSSYVEMGEVHFDDFELSVLPN
eukprot:Sspe_Gene.12246::Locus_4165_Transcript_1_1_Confidence_1.000_Length_2169::g.12246::m.12246